MYLAARSFGIQPSEFWEMTLPEFLAEVEWRRPSQPGDYAGTLTQADVVRLTELVDGAT